MKAHAALHAAIAKRKSPRFILRRRAMITSGDITIQVKTLDVSAQGFGVIASEPVKIGKTCALIFDSVVDHRVVQQTFHCETVYCILAGVEGFRIGLHIDAAAHSQKQQLEKIIAACSPLFV